MNTPGPRPRPLTLPRPKPSEEEGSGDGGSGAGPAPRKNYRPSEKGGGIFACSKKRKGFDLDR